MKSISCLVRVRPGGTCHCSSVCQEKLHEERDFKDGSGVTKFAERTYQV